MPDIIEAIPADKPNTVHTLVSFGSGRGVSVRKGLSNKKITP
jgi:hypothetical protein